MSKGNPLIKKPEEPATAATHEEANRVRSLFYDLLEPYLGTGSVTQWDCELALMVDGFMKHAYDLLLIESVVIYTHTAIKIL